MPKLVFEWDDPGDPTGNTAHIVPHGVTPAEAEQVVRNPRNSVGRSRSSTYPITFGVTKGGKSIAVVWSAVGTDPITVRVKTAYEVDPGGKKP